MDCTEITKLEQNWQMRYERAHPLTLVTGGNPLRVRHLRAEQTQAALAILVHQQQCPVCGGESLKRG